jgi:hypothetical protein
VTFHLKGILVILSIEIFNHHFFFILLHLSIYIKKKKHYLLYFSLSLVSSKEGGEPILLLITIDDTNLIHILIQTKAITRITISSSIFNNFRPQGKMGILQFLLNTFLLHKSSIQTLNQACM